MILYRPTGMEELRLVFESRMESWPARLPGQTIFYPLLNFSYAQQIARTWNTKEDPFAGYVTEFEIDDDYVIDFKPVKVGADEHKELWIPSQNLDKFNAHIVGKIRVMDAYFGDRFIGHMSNRESNFKYAKNAREQFTKVASMCRHSLFDLNGEMAQNKDIFFLHYPYWTKVLFSNEELGGYSKDQVLKDVKKMWESKFPDISLPTVVN